jgi:[FeFe] hydrogenase H-cluster maturation GTPase HydF
LNETPRGQRLHLAIFGRRNAGKSSLINALTGQRVAIVADVPGTTTDPVAKAMELLPLGPVMLIDTAGLDDTGELGRLRVEKSLDVLQKTDLVLLVVDPGEGFGACEQDMLARVRAKNLPVIAVVNKADLYPDGAAGEWPELSSLPRISVSASTGYGIDGLKRSIVGNAPRDWTLPTIVGDLLAPGDTVVLVVPIDQSAPKGRLILPQQQVIRDVLEHDAVAVVVKERELRHALSRMSHPPKLVVTDASVYGRAIADTPPGVLLTSFSILFARYKGDLETLAAGAAAVGGLRPGDRILVAEACTHHPIADDIGRVKIPRWLRQAAGGELHFDVMSGGGPLPANLEDYRLVVHCGACMLNRREMLSRIMQAQAAGVPIVNYGVFIAQVQGVLERALSPFPGVLERLGSGWKAPDADVVPRRAPPQKEQGGV